MNKDFLLAVLVLSGLALFVNGAQAQNIKEGKWSMTITTRWLTRAIAGLSRREVQEANVEMNLRRLRVQLERLLVRVEGRAIFFLAI